MTRSPLRRPTRDAASRGRGTTPDPAAAAGAAPRATRFGRPPWLDLRLVAGVVFVLVAVLGGARLASTAGSTTQVWSLARDLPAGSRLAAADLVPAAVHFSGTGEADRYLSATAVLVPGTTLRRSVSAGELLPRAALGSGVGPTVQLPLDVTAIGVPPGLAAGSLVDVWAVVPSGSGSVAALGSTAGAGLQNSGATAKDTGAVAVLTGVAVSSVSGGGSFAGSGTVVVTVSIPRNATTVATVLGRISGRSVVLLPVSGAVDGER